MINLAGRPTVTLDDVESATDFGRRVDRKYLVPLSALAALIDRVELPVMAIGDRVSFAYDSLYFDSPDLVSFRAAAYGRRDRFKVRTRVYRDSQYCVLEVKHEGLRRDTLKERIDYSIKDAFRLSDEAFTFLAERLPELERPSDLQPTLSTHYTRSTFADLEQRERLTVDTDVVGRRVDGSQFVLGEWAVLETKTSGRPSSIDRQLWNAGIRPRPLSKYCVSMAALHPELPRNRWHRSLQLIGNSPTIFAA
jgi:VTC domain